MQFPNLANFDNPPPVSEFERAHQVMRNGNSHEVMAAQQALSDYQAHPSAFSRAHEIITNTNDEDTRFFALSIINREITSMWNKFSPDEQNGIKTFIINQLIQVCGNGIESYRANRLSVSKYNQALVSIAKREYPSRWPRFVSDIVEGANSNEAMLENTLKIFTLLGEEVFEFGDRSNLMTSKWVETKRRALGADFQTIYEVCISVLQNSNDPSLVRASLKCIEKFAPFVRADYVFNGDALQFICGLVRGDLRDAALRVLSEVVAIPIVDGIQGNNQKALVVSVYSAVMESIDGFLPTNHSTLEPRVHALFAHGGNAGRDLVSSMAYFLTTFFMTHLHHMQNNTTAIQSGHQLLTGISHCDDKEIFKQTVDYWWWLGENCLRRREFSKVAGILSETFKNVRFVLIRKMPKPEEVIFVEDDHGEFQRQSMGDDVEALQLYARVREALIFYVKLDSRDTVQILYTLVDKQEDRSEFGYLSLGTLCWSIGSIAGVLEVSMERTLFTRIVRTLLTLCRDCPRTAERAMVASNIMYVAGQYSRFLATHLTFSQTVCKKLFEFMKESFDGVQDMAVDTFLKIAIAVPRNFFENDPQVNMPFIDYILNNLDDIVGLLNFAQINIFCEALGRIIGAGPEQRQSDLLDRLMHRSNIKIQESAEVAVHSPMMAQTTDHLKELIFVLKSHVAVAKTVGPVYLDQLCKIFTNLEGYYRFYVGAINNEVAQQGPSAIDHQHVRLMRAVKKEVLTIFEHFITSSNANNGANLQFIADTCLPPILNLVLEDYKESVPAAKEPIVLTLVSACVQVLSTQLNKPAVIQLILDKTFDCTVEMIAPTMHEHPDHRKNLLILLKMLCSNCFESYLECANNKPEIIEGMLWAIKHTDHALMVLALETLQDFVRRVSQSPLALGFFTAFLQRILTDVLLVVLDKMHTSALPYHCAILVDICKLVNDQAPDAPSIGRNDVEALLRECFSHLEFLTKTQIDNFIAMSFQGDLQQYIIQMQDFLIEIDVWGAAQENEESDRQARLDRENAVPELVRAQQGTRYHDMEMGNA